MHIGSLSHISMLTRLMVSPQKGSVIRVFEVFFFYPEQIAEQTVGRFVADLRWRGPHITSQQCKGIRNECLSVQAIFS